MQTTRKKYLLKRLKEKGIPVTDPVRSYRNPLEASRERHRLNALRPANPTGNASRAQAARQARATLLPATDEII